MLPKLNRLPAPEIRLVMRNGKKIHNPNLQLIYRPNALPVSRFAVIISTKVDKRATMRNRIKRLIHEALRSIFPTLTPSVDGVIIMKTSDIKSIDEAKKNLKAIFKLSC